MSGRSFPRRILAGLAFLAALAATMPALADYLGPNRTVTTWVWRRLHCHYQAVYDPPGPGWWGCYLNLYYPPDASCPTDVAAYFTPSDCSWPEAFCQTRGCAISRTSSIVSCQEGEAGCRAVAQTVTYPEATVSGSVT